MRLYTHATVHTFDPENPVATAVLVSQGQVVAAGNLHEMRELAPETLHLEEVDCGGKLILPGMIDGHLHATMDADSLAEVDLRSVRSIAEAVDAVVRHSTALPAGVWVTGGRWNFNLWESPGQPDRRLLDAAMPDRPVALWSLDYHTLWCNGAALAAAGISRDTPDPRGGEIVRDADGEPTGVLREDAATLVERVIPVPPIEVRKERMLAAQRTWLSHGITSVHDFDGEASRETWTALREVNQQLLRVVKYLRLEEFDWAKKTGWHTGDGDLWFMHGGLKLFSDGALGSRTSYMSAPYRDAVGEELGHGLQIATEDVLKEQIADALRHGISLAIHAIGDQANHHVLEAYAATRHFMERAERDFGRGFRNRIEHAQFVQPSDIARFAELDVVASMQPRHCIDDLHLLESIRPDEALAAYAWKELAAAGARVAFGSDGPVCATNPFPAIYAAMTRADIAGDPATSFGPAGRISAYTAIEAHTSGAAYAAGMENRMGRIKPGMTADFIVVDTDPLNGDGYNGKTGEAESEAALFEHAQKVRDTRVLMTVIDGTIAHQV